MLKHNSLRTGLLSEAHTYTVGFGGRPLLVVFGFGALLLQQIISLVTVAYTQDIRQFWLKIAIILCLALGGFSVWRVSKKIQLTVGQEGIIYAAGTYTLYTPWNNISKVVISPHNGEPALQLLTPAKQMTLEQGVSEQQAVLLSRLRTKHPLQVQSRYDLYNYIPLPVKMNKLRQDIQYYLPQLQMTVPSV